MKIRKIKPSDNAQVEQIIKTTIVEFGLPTTGTAYEDSETVKMYESYQNENEVYFVIESDGKVVGGAGIKALKNNANNVCELQKMYFSPSIRGKGLGKKLIEICIKKAKDFGYTQCYIETDPNMKAAISLYKKNGFIHLKGPLGNTGHCACGIWMLKNLNE